MSSAQFADILRSWEKSCETESYTLFLDSVKSYVQTTGAVEYFFNVTDTKTLHSIIYATFSDNYPSSVQKTILDLISFLGSNIFLRYRLITSFSILKTLVFGLASKTHLKADQLRLMRLLHLYTVDLHHICQSIEPDVFSCTLKYVIRIVRESKLDDILEPALGILANLSHYTNLVPLGIKKKDDFEALRKCLLHIMTSDNVSQAILVCSMAVRFYLWRSADKFFEGTHAHKTIQILFNLLLNGEISLPGLCAGELLSDLCSDSTSMNQLATFPDLENCLNEVVLQLKSKDASLLLKLLHLLRRLVKNKAHPNVRNHIVALFFQHSHDVSGTDGKDNGCDPLASLFTLASGMDELVATAALDLLHCIITSVQPDEEDDKENSGIYVIPFKRLLESLIFGIRKCHVARVTNFKFLRQFTSGHQSAMCARLLHLVYYVRVAEALIQHLHVVYRPETMSSICQFAIERIPVLVDLLSQTVIGQFDTNPLITILAANKSASEHDAVEETSDPAVDIDTCLFSADLAIEAMGLMYSCTELLSLLTPGASQDDEVSLTQPTGDGDTKSAATPSAARLCGRTLQSLIEGPEAPGLFALGLLTSSRAYPYSPLFSLGMGPTARIAVIRLLSASLHLDGFANEQFIIHLNRLQPIDGNRAQILDRVSNEPHGTDHTPSSFLSQWLCSSAGGCSQLMSANLQSNDMDSVESQLPKSTYPSLDNRELEQRVDKFLSTYDDHDTPKGDIPASDVLAIFEQKIRMLQSREDVLEASIRCNSEALSQAHRLCQHYRERAVIAEAESSQLRPLHLETIARLESSKRSISAYINQLEMREKDLADLRAQLSQKQHDYEEMVRKNEGLQAKLLAAREQNRAMDATIDDYRSQLDQAKEQIQIQTAQINKFTQITRLINDLTGNAPADVTTSAAQSFSSLVGDVQFGRESNVITTSSDVTARATTTTASSTASGVQTRKMPARNSRR